MRVNVSVIVSVSVSVSVCAVAMATPPMMVFRTKNTQRDFCYENESLRSKSPLPVSSHQEIERWQQYCVGVGRRRCSPSDGSKLALALKP
jgi:hypothetical protein